MKYEISKATAPAMPNLGKGTECVKLLLSQASKVMHEPLVPMFFPIFGAHIFGAEFQYPDFSWKEPTGMMANLVAKSGDNKGQLSCLVEAICRDFPLPYEGAYAQALYLLDHGFQPKPTHDESQLITEHNRRFEEPNDCEEAIRTFLRQPDGIGSSETMSSGDIMHELNYRGFRGREYNANNIGKTMRKLGFESKVIHGTRKYLVVKVDFALHTTENKEDAKEFTPDIF